MRDEGMNLFGRTGLVGATDLYCEKPPAITMGPRFPSGAPEFRIGCTHPRRGHKSATEENSRLDCSKFHTCDRVETSQTTSMERHSLGTLWPLSGCYQEERACWCERRDPDPCLEFLRPEPEREERLRFLDWAPLCDWPGFFLFLVFDLLLGLAGLPDPRWPLLVF